MGTPVVSVVTTVLDGERFIEECVRSVLDQPLAEVEVVVVDDGSTDDTAAVLAGIDDPRLVVVGRPHLGRGKALNEAVAHSTAPLVAVVDADDRCLPDRLTATVDFLSEHPDVDLVGSATWLYIDEAGNELGRRPAPITTDLQIRRVLRRHFAPFPHSSVTMRRSAFDAVGGYDEDLLLDVDLDFYVRLAGHGRLAAVTAPLVASRRHDDQYFDRRQGPTRSLRARVANRLTIERRADVTLGGSTAGVRVTLREVGAWAYWHGRRPFGGRPILPEGLRRRLDRRWARDLRT
jgi:glycosyltransferase involved in cell wall biosynthesis